VQITRNDTAAVSRRSDDPDALASRPAAPARVPRDLRRAFDVVAIVLLGLGAYVARRGTMPTDGLWFDDSWVAAGAIHGSPTALLSHGSGTPGFTAILMAVHRLGGSLHDLGIPSLVAGVAAPPLLYLALRSWGFERAIAALLSAALVVSRVHVLYSGRVKGYTFDVIWVLLLAIALPRLARRTWRWPIAVGWLVAAIVIGTFSAYLIVAVAVAGVVLVLNPRDDRWVRVAAVGAQAVVQLGYFAVSTRKADFDAIEKVLGTAFDAHVDFTWNPVRFADESLTHLRRVAQVYPGGSSVWLTILGIVAVVGLVVAVVKGNRTTRVVGEFFLLSVLAAYVGSVLHKFPFGPTTGQQLSAGGRYGLWLLPAVAFGLAVVAQRLRRLVSQSDVMRFGFDAAAVVTAVAIVFVAYTPALPAPFQGSETASRYLDDALRPGDALIVTVTSTFAYADSTRSPVKLVATPKHQVGFAPVYENPQIHVVGEWAAEPSTSADIERWVRDARRVYVLGAGPRRQFGLADVSKVLTAMGFRANEINFQWNVVQIWER
jgi:hypothetical protein